MLEGTEFESYFGDLGPAYRFEQFSLAVSDSIDFSVTPGTISGSVFPRASLYRKLAEPLGSMDTLLESAIHLEPDGGASGQNAEERALNTVRALLQFLSQAHTPSEGAFRAHVERMVRFLETLDVRKELLSRVIAFARAGKKPHLAPVNSWNDIEAAIGVQNSASATP